MLRNGTISLLALAGALAAGTAARPMAAQDTAAPTPSAQDTTARDHKPVTPKQVAKNVGAETHRVAHRTGKTLSKAGKDTEKQAHRTGKSLERGAKRLVSRKARREQKHETPPAQRTDSTPR